MKIIKRGILIVAALMLFAIVLVSCLRGGHMMSIAITPASPFMATGSTQQFTATATLTDGTTISWTQAVIWAAADPSVTFINTPPSNGLATAITTTITTISATDPLNSIVSSATLTVRDPDSITVHPAKPYMWMGTSSGTSYQFTGRANFNFIISGATYTYYQDVTSSPSFSWDTSDHTLATMSTTTGSFGLLTIATTAGTTPGSTFNIVMADSASVPLAPVTATVTWTDNQLQSIAVTTYPLNSPTYISIGGTQLYTATGNYPVGTLSGITQDFTNSVTWSSSNLAVATIDPDSGGATGVAAGTTMITATDPITGIAGSATLTVQ